MVVLEDSASRVVVFHVNVLTKIASLHGDAGEAIPIYVEELLLQLTYWVECTT